MKNILFLHAGAELYGADIILFNLVKNINKDEFNVYVILPDDGPLVKKMRDANIYCEIIDYPILRRKYFSLKGFVYYVTHFFKNSNKIYQLVKDKNIDIIHNNTFAVLEGIYLKKKLNAKLILHVHEIIKNPKFLSKILSKIFSKQSNKIICVSEAVSQEVKRHIKEVNKVEVIYNGIDNNIFHPNYDVSSLKKEFKIPSSCLVIGMIGRVNSWKGQSDFLQAIETVLNKHKSVYALLVGGVFAGEEWRYLELERKINELNLLYDNRIILSDFRDDNYLIHNLIDIFVLPSTNPDPLPTVILESMASGKPIVAYRHGGVCEMVKDGYNGILVSPCCIELLSSAIEELVIDYQKRNEMGSQSYIREITNFSLNNQISNFERVYKLLDRGDEKS